MPLLVRESAAFMRVHSLRAQREGRKVWERRKRGRKMLRGKCGAQIVRRKVWGRKVWGAKYGAHSMGAQSMRAQSLGTQSFGAQSVRRKMQGHKVWGAKCGGAVCITIHIHMYKVYGQHITYYLSGTTHSCYMIFLRTGL